MMKHGTTTLALALVVGCASDVADFDSSQADVNVSASEDTEADAQWSSDDFLPEKAESPAPASQASVEPQRYEESELTGRSNSFLWFRWTKGDADVILRPTSTHVCGLTMVRGQLANGSVLKITRSGGNWVLTGTQTASNTLQGDAVCEPLSAFRTDAGRTVSVIGRDNFDWSIGSVNTNVDLNLPMPAGTAPILMGLAGRFEGGGERARVTLAPNVQMKVGGQAGFHMAFAAALSFGFTSPPFYDSYFLDGIAVSDGYTFNIPKPPFPGNETIELYPISVAPLSTTFCYLSSVSGDYNGADEWVQVFPDRNRGDWTIYGNRGSGNGITGRASCVKMDQRGGSGVIR
jgi:hypothetical protein